MMFPARETGVLRPSLGNSGQRNTHQRRTDKQRCKSQHRQDVRCEIAEKGRFFCQETHLLSPVYVGYGMGMSEAHQIDA